MNQVGPHVAQGIRLNIQPSLCIFSFKSATTCRKCAIPKKRASLWSLLAQFEHDTCSLQCVKKRGKKKKKITSSCYSRRFLRWKCQLGVWQNDGALRGSFSRTSLGPLLCGGRFLTPVIATVRPATISAALKRAYHLPLSSRRRLSILYPGKYPVALGRNTAGFALVRCPWLVTVWLTHSAMMWGHLRWSARCTLAAKCCNCRAPRSSPPHFVCQRWRSCPPTRCWSVSRHSAAL